MTPRAQRSGADDLRPAILFVSHDVWQTGAPIVLLHLLRWLKAKTDVQFQILLREDVGELRRNFEQVGPVFSWNERGPAPAPRAWSLGRWKSRKRALGDLKSAHVGLIYSNTITNGEVLEKLAHYGLPVITHVHELEYWIRHRIDAANVQQNRRFTSHFIAASKAVKANLVENVGISPDRVDVIYEFIPTDSRVRTERPDHLRERLGIPSDAFVVCASGTTDWRKGPDIFVQLAALLRRDRPEQTVHFVWVGGAREGADFAALWHDVTRAGVGDRVHFVGLQPNPLDYFEACDAFAVVSREDPFPLVCLEAASLGKPVVCFDDSGGAREFVEDDAGIIVPYLDLNAMAKAIRCLIDNPSLRSELGRRGADKVRRHHDVSVVGPQILDVIQRFLPSVARER